MEDTFLYSPDSLESLEFDLPSQTDCNFSGLLNDFDFALNHNTTAFTGQTNFPSEFGKIPCQTSSDSSNEIVELPSTAAKKRFRDNSVSIENESLMSSVKNSLIINEKGPFQVCITDGQDQTRAGRCYPVGDSNSKNAIAARDNRLKKKQYVNELEQTVQVLRRDNDNLSQEVFQNKNRLSELENEVKYLKSVIANQSTLAAILTSVSKTPGISFSTSFSNEKCEENKTSNEKLIKPADRKLNLKSSFKSSSNQRSLRSRSKVGKLSSQALNCGVQNMTPKEIVLCCEKEKMKRFKSTCEDSETDSDTQDDNYIVDVDDSSKAKIPPSPTPEDYGGVCLHVTGNKVSLEFCSSCNMKSRTDVSLDHSYSYVGK